VHAIRSGGTAHVPVAAPEAFPKPGPLDLPGRPAPVPTPGHTDGHCAYHLPDAGVLISGDALVSGHPTSRAKGPQLLPDMFHRERARAVASLEVLAGLEGEVMLPGHGPVHHGSVRDAALRARERAL
jgi:glyoxylase-like metal-dependent hydrolase (beta-lactamase superfamily II)